MAKQETDMKINLKTNLTLWQAIKARIAGSKVLEAIEEKETWDDINEAQAILKEYISRRGK